MSKNRVNVQNTDSRTGENGENKIGGYPTLFKGFWIQQTETKLRRNSCQVLYLCLPPNGVKVYVMYRIEWELVWPAQSSNKFILQHSEHPVENISNKNILITHTFRMGWIEFGLRSSPKYNLTVNECSGSAMIRMFTREINIILCKYLFIRTSVLVIHSAICKTLCKISDNCTFVCYTKISLHFGGIQSTFLLQLG